MPTFEIRYGEFERTHSGAFHWFDVRCGDVEERIAVGLSRLVRRQWGLGSPEDAEQVQEMERRVAVRYLRDHLATAAALTPHRIVLTAREEPESGKDQTVFRAPEELPYEWKECRYRMEKRGEYHCSASLEDDDWGDKTTLAVCQGCALPSTDVACSGLVHPSTRSIRNISEDVTRQLCYTHCEIGHPVNQGSVGECVAGRRDCWFQTYTPDQEAEAAERDLAAEALDLIDTLNIVFRDQFGAGLFRLKQFRTGRVLLGQCTTEEAFAHKLEVLGDLIDLINSKELCDTQGLKSEDGSINRLLVFLDKMAPGEAPPVIQILRDIKTLRKHMVAHSTTADHFVDASGRLGIGQPIADWNLAWENIMGAFLDALRRLQALLP